ncbi:MAG: PilZ domain-containing protein [Gaiellales bacterium]
MSTQTDRRAFLRVLAELPVTWSRLEPGGEPDGRWTGTTVDVSAGGVKMHTLEPVHEGERLRVEVRYAPPPILVFAEATVVRVDEGDHDECACALRYDGLDRYVEQRLVRWVYSEQRRAADRRASARIPLQLVVTCRPLAADSTPQEAFRAGMLDLACDGMRLLTDRVLAGGDRIRVDLDVGDPPRPLTVRGRIVWREQADSGRWMYGMQFGALDAPAQRDITARATAHEQRLRHSSAETTP